MNRGLLPDVLQKILIGSVGGKMKYDASMIQTVDAVEAIRSHREMYLPVDRAVGAYLAHRVAEMAELCGSAPAIVEHRGQWWKVSSEVDWLRDYSGPRQRDVFHELVPLPIAGQNHFHPEVLLTAYASVVVDIAGDVIAKRPQDYPIPDAIREWVVPSSGRTICFEVTND